VAVEWGDVLLRAISARTEQTTDGGEDTKVVTISRADQNGNIDKKVQLFRSPLAF
jgi:hypothetical protein